MNTDNDKYTGSENFQNIFSKKNIDVDEKYFNQILLKAKEKTSVAPNKLFIKPAWGFAASFVIIICLWLFSKTESIDIQDIPQNEVYEFVTTNNLVSREDIYKNTDDEILTKIDEKIYQEVAPENLKNLELYGMEVNLKDLDDEMLQDFHNKLLNTKLLGDL